MHLHITTIMFIIFEHINKIFTQGIPISPCPKMFQYRFDGAEWFGILSVRNPDFGQALHLRVTLSMRGKPTTNYLGEIELLTRGQFLSDTPVLYKIKFPKNHFPPKLLQITTNNQVVCLGAQDHSIFVTQIQLEHTRKFTFLPDEIPPPIQTSSSSSSSSSASSSTATMGLGGGHSASISALPITTGMKESSILPTNIAFGTKHLPLTNMEKNPMRLSKDICGTIDDRIRFQVLHALKQTTTSIVSSSSFSSSSSTTFKNQADSVGSLLLSAILPRPNDEISTGGSKTATVATKARGQEGDEHDEDDGDDSLPPLVTSDTDLNSDFMLDDAASTDGSMTINELPSITRGAWPWLAAVYVNNLTSLAYQCGGTLVSPRIVISAAHCFQLFKKRYTANEVLVFLGRHNLKNWNEEGSLAAPVDDIFIHPDYNQHLNSYDADIAVVVLKNEVRFNTFIRPACMWSGSTKTQYIEGEHGIVVGWGLGGFNTSKHTSTTSTVPKIVSTPIVSNDICFKANPKYRSLSSNRTFCAGIMLQASAATTKSEVSGKPLNFQQQLHQGPCTGDSGAGLMIFKNNRWMLRGTVSGVLPMQAAVVEGSTSSTTSRTSQSCSINQYVIYTDVAKFLDWIFAFII
ncbi:serine protease gd [Lucilia sericata]|uniref:serine protease gd n=1 Tax=Lucilia sericata TaxID=13632 RepID=UPI0018A8627E|nr:serine protease gd [Lucilia sericata]